MRNSGEMKRVNELDVYKPAEALSDMARHDFDKWSNQKKSLSELNVTEYKAIVEKLGPKLNAFINSTKV